MSQHTSRLHLHLHEPLQLHKGPLLLQVVLRARPSHPNSKAASKFRAKYSYTLHSCHGPRHPSTRLVAFLHALLILPQLFTLLVQLADLRGVLVRQRRELLPSTRDVDSTRTPPSAALPSGGTSPHIVPAAACFQRSSGACSARSRPQTAHMKGLGGITCSASCTWSSNCLTSEKTAPFRCRTGSLDHRKAGPAVVYRRQNGN